MVEVTVVCEDSGQGCKGELESTVGGFAGTCIFKFADQFPREFDISNENSCSRLLISSKHETSTSCIWL